MVKENIRIFAISINKQESESESDLSYSQESESEVQTTDSPALVTTNSFKQKFLQYAFGIELHISQM